MTRFRLATAVSLLCLLSFATSASAECAWVLWYERIETFGAPGGQLQVGAPSWNLVQASPLERDCQRALIGKVQDNLRPVLNYTVKRIADNMVFVGREGEDGAVNTLTTRWVCLPDTVDPRGPKRK